MRAEIKAFAEQIESEIEANAYKGCFGSWVSMDPMALLFEVNYHSAKLGRAILNNDLDAVKEYAADVAALSMMVQDSVVARMEVSGA